MARWIQFLLRCHVPHCRGWYAAPDSWAAIWLSQSQAVSGSRRLSSVPQHFVLGCLAAPPVSQAASSCLPGLSPLEDPGLVFRPLVSWLPRIFQAISYRLGCHLLTNLGFIVTVQTPPLNSYRCNLSPHPNSMLPWIRGAVSARWRARADF